MGDNQPKTAIANVRSSSNTSSISNSTTGAVVDQTVVNGRRSNGLVPIENIAERLFQVIRSQERILETAGIDLRSGAPGGKSKAALSSSTTGAPKLRSSLHNNPNKAPLRSAVVNRGALGASTGEGVATKRRTVSDVESSSSSYATIGSTSSPVPEVVKVKSKHVDPSPASILSPPEKKGGSKLGASPATKNGSQLRRRAANVNVPSSGSPDPSPLSMSTADKEQTLEDVQQLLSTLAERGVVLGKTPRRQTSARFKPVSARRDMTSGRRTSMGGAGNKSPKLLTGQGKLSKLKQRREAVKLQRAEETTGQTSTVARRPRLQSDVQDQMAELEQLRQDNAKQGESHLPRERLRREPSRSAPNVTRSSILLEDGPPVVGGAGGLPVKPIWDPAKPPAQILPPEDRRQQQAKPQVPTGYVSRAPAVHLGGGGGPALKHEPLRRMASSTLGLGAKPTAGATKKPSSEKKPSWSSSIKK